MSSTEPRPSRPSGVREAFASRPSEAPDAFVSRPSEAREAFASRLTAEIGRVVVGQRQVVERVLIGLLCRGHVLLEGVPGIAKTLLARSVAEAVRADFSRVQFTPDLLPADLIGTLIYDQSDGTFAPRKGPVFTNFLLADEINRAPAKVQSALLEAMQERQVTIGDETWRLEEPFLVLATQNPIEQEGTYPLPEAQVDRFMMKLKMGFPALDEEREILARMANHAVPRIRPVVGPGTLALARDVVEAVHVDGRVRDYVLSLVRATREPAAFGLDIGPLVEHGASPRASLDLYRAARARAFLAGRDFTAPEDVKLVAPDVLRHRLILSYEAEAEEVEGDEIVRRVLDAVEVP